MWSAKPAILVSATATVPSFGSGNGPEQAADAERYAAGDAADLDAGAPRREPAARMHVGEAAADQRAARPANARVARPYGCPFSGEPRHTTRPMRSGMRLSSIAQIKTPPKLWPTRCTVSPGTASMKAASAAAFAASEPVTDG